ncbi:hypothetical protein HMPREF1321_0999 [Capnocytophaga sp. oral taxon 412 str. F0487]|nr:hypothetical protein HMPREF1321_0999 [Capnocytophaga sp. oral taxon 412 str. F0487]
MKVQRYNIFVNAPIVLGFTSTIKNFAKGSCPLAKYIKITASNFYVLFSNFY